MEEREPIPLDEALKRLVDTPPMHQRKKKDDEEEAPAEDGTPEAEDEED